MVQRWYRRLSEIADWRTVSDSTASPFAIDTTHPRGAAFADWLVHVDATPTRGVVDLIDVRAHVGEVDPHLSTRWIYKEAPHAVKLFSFHTPVGVAPSGHCGRAFYADMHVAGGGLGEFPEKCGPDLSLSAQEQVAVFFLFDLSACVQDDGALPAPPPLVR